MKVLLSYLILFVKLIFADNNNSNGITRLPAEWEPHLKTFMIWPKSVAQWKWKSERLPAVRKDIARIANALVDFEPVVIFADPSQVSSAESQLDKRIKVIGMPIDDLWARDTMPLFTLKTQMGYERVVAVDFNFNGWGNKQIHGDDALLARRVVKMYKMQSRTSTIVAEGGSFETDGKGTLLVTKSSLVNTNRNTKSMDEIEMELKALLGVKKVIWFEGAKGADMTDGHIDGLVRFVRPGVVVLNIPFHGNCPDILFNATMEAASVLRNATDADGNFLKVIQVVEADPNEIEYVGDKEDFLWSYVNFLIGNGCVIIPAFGDKTADSKALTTFQELFPDRKVVSVFISVISARGGGIHCATRELSRANLRQKINRQEHCFAWTFMDMVLIATSKCLKKNELVDYVSAAKFVYL